MKPLFVAALLIASTAGTIAQTPDSTKTQVAKRGQVKADDPKATPNQHLGSPDAMADPEMNLRLNALNGVGTAPMIWRIDTRYEGLRGTPYFQTEWAKGQIDLVNGKKYTDVPIKFDAHRQALILLRPKQGNDSIIINQQTVNQFRLSTSAAGDTDGREYIFKRFPTVKADDPTVRDGYFLVLYEGKTALLKRVAKSFRAADYKAAYSSGVRYDTYADANTYYVLKPDQKLTKVKLSKKSLLDALDNRSDALKTFADKLSFKSEADAATLVQQYDNL
ncbi:hypothetical protein [Spirosoma arcticum]